MPSFFYVIVGISIGLIFALFGADSYYINALRYYIPASQIAPGWWKCPQCDTGLRHMPGGDPEYDEGHAKGWRLFGGVFVTYAPWGYHDMPGRFISGDGRSCSGNCMD